MKTATLILALFMLIKPVLPVVEYVVFYDYIKNELCVNKDKPKLECNGKCHLKKELARASDTSENGQDKKHFSVETSVYFYQDTLFDFNKIVFISTKEKIIPLYLNSYHNIYCSSLLKPPVFA